MIFFPIGFLHEIEELLGEVRFLMLEASVNNFGVMLIHTDFLDEFNPRRIMNVFASAMDY